MIERLKNLAADSVELVSCKDSKLFELAVKEETISHRLAFYLENLIIDLSNGEFDGSVVDCEYNRHGDEEKRLFEIIDKYPKKKTDIIRPDIVLHNRGNNQKNLIIFEVKKNNGRYKEYAKDKLKAYVDSSSYNYKLGVYVEFFVGQKYRMCCNKGKIVYKIEFFESKISG